MLMISAKIFFAVTRKHKRFWPKKMASCFEFRVRTSSFDLHQLSQRHKLAKISKLFRSSSESSVKKDSPKNSPKGSPKGSPTAPVTRRRFLRVVTNEESKGAEYENPHLIRRYTKEYVHAQWSQRSSASFDEQALPYSVTGHTILKKPSVDSPTGSGDMSPVQTKHASFKEEVQIIEFDKKCKIKTCECFTHVEKLQDSDVEDSTEPCVFCQKKGVQDCPHLSSDSEQSDSDIPNIPVEKPHTSTQSECQQSDSSSKTPGQHGDPSSEVDIHHKEDSPDSIVDKFVSVHTDLETLEWR